MTKPVYTQAGLIGVHVDHRGDVHVAMRVDPTHDQTR
jgi:hypothetical protein